MAERLQRSAVALLLQLFSLVFYGCLLANHGLGLFESQIGVCLHSPGQAEVSDPNDYAIPEHLILEFSIVAIFH